MRCWAWSAFPPMTPSAICFADSAWARCSDCLRRWPNGDATFATRAEGYTLDLDSTVFERYGKQKGSLK